MGKVEKLAAKKRMEELGITKRHLFIEKDFAVTEETSFYFHGLTLRKDHWVRELPKSRGLFARSNLKLAERLAKLENIKSVINNIIYNEGALEKDESLVWLNHQCLSYRFAVTGTENIKMTLNNPKFYDDEAKSNKIEPKGKDIFFTYGAPNKNGVITPFLKNVKIEKVNFKEGVITGLDKADDKFKTYRMDRILSLANVYCKYVTWTKYAVTPHNNGVIITETAHVRPHELPWADNRAEARKKYELSTPRRFELTPLQSKQLKAKSLKEQDKIEITLSDGRVIHTTIDSVESA